MVKIPEGNEAGKLDSPSSASNSRKKRVSLVLGGGGVKGLALAGAVMELEDFYEFEEFAGTSAGAIAAVLLAAGYTGDDLRDELQALDLESLLDGLWKQPYNFFVHGGLHSGDEFREWIDRKLRERLRIYDPTNQSRVPFETGRDALKKRAVVYAASNKGTMTFDSDDPPKETSASFVVRCSTAIPYFFCPESHDGEDVYDGGLLNNFPLVEFANQNPNKNILAVYLTSSTPREPGSGRLGQLIQIVLGRDEAAIIKKYPEHVVKVDTTPINTLDFDLTQQEKNLLVLSGRIAALRFLDRPNKPDASRLSDEQHLRLEYLISRRKALIDAVKWPRRRRKLWRWTRRILLAASVIALGLVWYGGVAAPAAWRQKVASYACTMLAAPTEMPTPFVSLDARTNSIEEEAPLQKKSQRSTNSSSVERQTPSVRAAEYLIKGLENPGPPEESLAVTAQTEATGTPQQSTPTALPADNSLEGVIESTAIPTISEPTTGRSEPAGAADQKEHDETLRDADPNEEATPAPEAHNGDVAAPGGGAVSIMGNLRAGDGAASRGGNAIVQAGDGYEGASGGSLTIGPGNYRAGDGGAGGDGGDLILKAGDAR